MKQAGYNVQAFTGPALNKQPRNPRQRDVAVIIAGGPSLTREDVAKVEQADVDIIGINNAYQICSRMEIHYACDTKWWRAHWDKIPDGPARYSLKDGRKNKQDSGVPGVIQLRMGNRRGLSDEWPFVCWGGNGGYQAINLAYLLGYKKVVLLGYDMSEQNKKAHWHSDHNFPGSTNPCKSTFTMWRKDFEPLASALQKKGIEVVNVTRRTLLSAFPQATLEEIL